MINARLEAKNIAIWLFVIALFICAAIVSLPFLGLLDDDLLYQYLPFLNFGIAINGSIFGREIPAVIKDNFNFASGIICVIAAVALVFHIIYVIILNVLRGQRRKAAKVLKREGYTQQYFDLIERKRRRLAGRDISCTNDLCAAAEYCDGRRYESAFEILRNINVDEFDLKDATVYYALYAYTFILTGDLKNARFALELGEPFAEKLKESIETDFAKALLMYAEHDFDGAKEGFKKIISSRNQRLKVWSGMYLGLIYLRMHKKEKARKLAVSLSGIKKTPRQSEDMLKLLKKIEAAYAMEAEEEAARESSGEEEKEALENPA